MLPAGTHRTGLYGLAKPGDIKLHCAPNALSSFKEYLQNYASPETATIGNHLITETVSQMEGVAKQRAEKLIKELKLEEMMFFADCKFLEFHTVHD